MGIQSFLLALQHVRRNWNLKCLIYLITFKYGTLLLIDFPKALAISHTFCMDNWARGFLLCRFYHADHCICYFQGVQVVPAHSAKILVNRLDTVCTCLWQKSGQWPVLIPWQKEKFRYILDNNQSSEYPVSWHWKWEKKVNFVVSCCGNNVGTKATKLCLCWVLK